ncbi:MAG: hypothetical protein JO364_20895 [Pseudonocardiales bacterium]|nr:hypothetical protein [Pseudonocardiales bacterium]
MVALAGVLIAAIPRLMALGRRPPTRPVDTLAALLAEAVEGQWRQAAIERRLVTPAPIPLRWSLSGLAVTGAVAVAVGAPAFPPLPQQARITEADLHAGGGRDELHHVYAGLASGRVIVVGAPGAGKSGTAILLLLDALAHRDRLDDTQRARVPVPVLLTVHGWDPNICSVRDWLRDQLTAIYPLFAHRGGRAEAAALVTARDKVTLILDGLDEMDTALRPAALQALSDAPFRVVVLTRSREMVQAASETWLTGAIAVHLHDVTAPDAADYLQRARTDPPPEGWADLLTRLGERPDGVLARGLSTPLTLTLLRDTYQAGDDIRELLDPTRYRTADAIERDLIARVLPAAYTPRPGRPAPRYTEAQARQTLSFIARKMGKDRDLAWWHIPRWAPTAPRVVATVLMFGLTGGFFFGRAGGLWFAVGLVVGGVVGLVGELRVGRTDEFWRSEPRRLRIANWRAAISRRTLRRALVSGLVVGLMGGLVMGLVLKLVSGLLGGLAAGLAGGLADVLTEPGTAPGLPVGPRQAWRNDRLSGLAVGLVFGLVIGPVLGGLAVGLVFGPVIGLVSGLVGAQTWRITLAWFQLQLARQVPAVRLIPFLEDARERDILRTVGAVYQFRHATLQDQLAAVPRPS